jgi:hypothetical protein
MGVFFIGNDGNNFLMWLLKIPLRARLMVLQGVLFKPQEEERDLNI